MTSSLVQIRQGECNNYNIDDPALTFPYELDDFQKYAVLGIEQGENVLVSVPTGAGKTSVCLYAMAHTLKRGQKVIYTSPIKSLSNQKFKEFKDKFEALGLGSVGILTGDIKFNPEADCLIMTTEILRNLLYRQGESKNREQTEADTEEASQAENTDPSKIQINVDLEEIGCVVFDEVHYINDRDRGKVWEETIVMLPPRILLIMLSATIDKPEKFATWVADLKQRPVNLITSNFRPVPLNHFIFSFNPDNDGRGARVTVDQTTDHGKIGLLHKIMNESNQFIDGGYDSARQAYRARYLDPVTGKPKKMKGRNTQQTNIEMNRMELSPNHLNPFFRYLQHKNLLPALVFVLSRKNCETYGSNISVSLVTGEESAEIEKVFQYYMHPYMQQYQNLYQFTFVKDLLKRGVGVHHSGLVPILKEIVEILFSMSLIKILFCTETFAVGVNMPTKTVVFTEMEKFDGHLQRRRFMKTDEYLQMAGRAGRRGLDTLGTVIHFPLRELPYRGDLKGIMTGKTPEIVSKFSQNYQFILKVIESDSHGLMDFVNSSLLSQEQRRYLEAKVTELETPEAENDVQENHDEDLQKRLEQYHKIKELISSGFTFKAKQMKQYGEQLKKLSNNHRTSFLQAYDRFLEDLAKQRRQADLTAEIEYLKTKNLEETKLVLQFLQELGYVKLPDESLIQDGLQNLDKDVLQLKGLVAAQVSECNEILLTEMLFQGIIDSSLTLPELAGLLAVFIDSSSSDEQAHVKHLEVPDRLKSRLTRVQELADDLYYKEEAWGINQFLETDWTFYTDFIQPAYFWADEQPLQKIYEVTNIYEGNFIRGILKISHMAETLVSLAETMQRPELAKLAETLSNSLIRGEVTVNSLYVK